jgi:hypothetical protein
VSDDRNNVFSKETLQIELPCLVSLRCIRGCNELLPRLMIWYGSGTERLFFFRAGRHPKPLASKSTSSPRVP